MDSAYVATVDWLVNSDPAIPIRLMVESSTTAGLIVIARPPNPRPQYSDEG